MQVTVYRSSAKEGLYVYLGEDTTLENLPGPVMKQLGTPEKALEFDLSADRNLPNANTEEVILAIESQGFYVQMPRDIEAILAQVANESGSSAQ